MSHQSPSDRQGSVIPIDRFETVKELLLAKQSDDLRRELHGLIETIQEEATRRDNIIRFIIGVSFTEQGTCFDYWIDRVVTRNDNGIPRVEEVKPPINTGHPYLTFHFPPDPEFDAGNLRGAMLAAIERKQIEAIDDADEEADSMGWMGRIRMALDVLRGRTP